MPILDRALFKPTMYPFMITWDRELIGTLSFTNSNGIEFTLVHFWYPKFRVDRLGNNANFVTDNKPYPDLSNDWQYYEFDKDYWSEIPF